MGDTNLEIHDAEDTLFSFHVSTSHMMYFLHKSDMLYDPSSYYNLTRLLKMGSFDVSNPHGT